VKRLATVLLTGDGGDDVFFGYPFFPECVDGAKACPAAATGDCGGLEQGRLCYPGLWAFGQREALSELCQRRAWSFYPGARRAAILSGAWNSRGTTGRTRTGPNGSFHRRLPPRAGCCGSFFSYHRNQHFVSEFMVKIDGGTMHYALEARAPFLDQKSGSMRRLSPPRCGSTGKPKSRAAGNCAAARGVRRSVP